MSYDPSDFTAIPPPSGERYRANTFHRNSDVNSVNNNRDDFTFDSSVNRVYDTSNESKQNLLNRSNEAFQTHPLPPQTGYNNGGFNSPRAYYSTPSTDFYRAPPLPPPKEAFQIHDPFNDKSHSQDNKWKSKISLQLPIFTYLVTLVDIGIFIYELVKMKQLTGSAFQTQPYFNPMLGPSSNVQIFIGSRFKPCMAEIDDITTDLTLQWPCPNSTTLATQVCSLSELCNFEAGNTPDQTWRILSAMFLHAGFVHILFNLLLQMTIGREVEIEIGTLRYAMIYLGSGLSGNLFGLNFAGDGVSSSGASGALFGSIALNLIIFTMHKDRRRIRSFGLLVFILIAEIIITLVLGLLPGLDNFAHIGGFVNGLLCSVIFLNNPNFVLVRGKRREKKGTSFSFKYDDVIKKHFWIWIIARVIALLLLIAWFVGLALNFTRNGGGKCSWCKYLSCLPVNNWCEIGDLSTSTTT